MNETIGFELNGHPVTSIPANTPYIVVCKGLRNHPNYAVTIVGYAGFTYIEPDVNGEARIQYPGLQAFPNYVHRLYDIKWNTGLNQQAEASLAVV